MTGIPVTGREIVETRRQIAPARATPRPGPATPSAWMVEVRGGAPTPGRRRVVAPAAGRGVDAPHGDHGDHGGARVAGRGSSCGAALPCYTFRTNRSRA